MKAERLILVHLFASLFMTGVIWTVQLVHYPLFDEVAVQTFPRFEQSHALRIGFVVIPPMTIELITASLLVGKIGAKLAGPARFWLAGLTVLIWLLTFLIHLPQHEILARGFDEKLHGDLVWTNWGRTML